MRISDWSSDVCSSDLLVVVEAALDPVDLAMEEVDQGPEQVREIVLEPGLAQQLSADVEDVVQRPFAGLRLRQGAGIGLVLVRPVAVERQCVEPIGGG